MVSLTFAKELANQNGGMKMIHLRMGQIQVVDGEAKKKMSWEMSKENKKLVIKGIFFFKLNIILSLFLLLAACVVDYSMCVCMFSSLLYLSI